MEAKARQIPKMEALKDKGILNKVHNVLCTFQ